MMVGDINKCITNHIPNHPMTPAWLSMTPGCPNEGTERGFGVPGRPTTPWLRLRAPPSLGQLWEKVDIAAEEHRGTVLTKDGWLVGVNSNNYQKYHNHNY